MMVTHVRERSGNVEGIGLGRYVLPLLILSAFGPLLIPSAGLRLDQLFVYLMLPIAFGLVCVGRRSSLFRGPSLYLIGSFTFITVWTLVVTFGGISEHIVASDRTKRDEWVAFEDYFFVISLMLVIGEFVKIHNPDVIRSLIDKIGLLLIILMCLNSLLAIGSIFFELTPITSLFAGRDLQIGDEDWVGKARKTGIFDAPSTAGFAYSIVLLLCGYIARKADKVSVWGYLVGLLIFVGGCVSISKVFLIGGVPLFLIYWFLPGRRNPSISWILIILIIGIIGVWLLTIDDIGSKESWGGFYLLLDLFNPDVSVQYTSFFDLFVHFIEIRYGVGSVGAWDDKAIIGIFPYVWDVAPVQGLGFAYFGIFDSAYLQMFMQGGLVSVLVYMSIILTIISVGIIEWSKGYETGRLLAFLGLIAFLGGIGQPVVTTSRANVIFWVLILLIFAVRSARLIGENKSKSL